MPRLIGLIDELPTEKDVIEACRDAYDLITVRSEDLLAERTGKHSTLVLVAMDRANRKGLIEYGVSLGTAWPTPRGLRLIAQSS